MARRIDGWTDVAALPPLGAESAEAASAADGSAAAGDPRDRDESDRLAMADRAVCDCPDYRRDKVCDHVLMAAAVRMVRRMIVAHADADKPH